MEVSDILWAILGLAVVACVVSERVRSFMASVLAIVALVLLAIAAISYLMSDGGTFADDFSLKEFFGAILSEQVMGTLTEAGLFQLMSGWGLILVIGLLFAGAYLLDSDAALAVMTAVGTGVGGVLSGVGAAVVAASEGAADLLTSLGEATGNLIGGLAEGVFSNPWALAAAGVAIYWLFFRDDEDSKADGDEKTTVIVQPSPPPVPV